LAYEDLARIASDSGERLDDLEDRLWNGTAVGEIFKVFFALYCTAPSLASWEKATQLAERTAARHRVPGSRSSFYAARHRFKSVAHLWAAWSIRGRAFQSNLEVGYEGWHDFQFFLAESEILREWGQSWQIKRAKSKPPLPTEVWHVPDSWVPPKKSSGWPQAGAIPVIKVEEELLSCL
jgi:hypothetical protein